MSSSSTSSSAKVVLPPRPASGRTEAANAPFVPVDSIAHAASVIKSLRSSSVSAQRYQRCAYNQLIPNLPHFNQMVAETGVEHTEKRAMEAYMEQAIAAGNYNPTLGNSSGNFMMPPARNTINDSHNASSSSSSSSQPSKYPHATMNTTTATAKSSSYQGTMARNPRRQTEEDDDDDLLGLGNDRWVIYTPSQQYYSFHIFSLLISHIFSTEDDLLRYPLFLLFFSTIFALRQTCFLSRTLTLTHSRTHSP